MIDEKKLIKEIRNMVLPLTIPEVDDGTILAYNEALVDVLNAIDEQPKVGKWIPVEETMIRDALELRENEEFNLINPNGVPFPERFRLTSNSLQIYHPQEWEEAHGMTLKALLRGDLKVAKLPFKPKEFEFYYFVSLYTGRVLRNRYTENNDANRVQVKSGNCYSTEEEAAKHVDEWMEKIYGKEWRKLYEHDTSN